MWCHLLLTAPVWALVVFLFLPWPIALPLYLVIAVGSLVLYRYIWRAMQQPPRTGPEALIGRECVAMEKIQLRGLVRCGSEMWTALTRTPLTPGQRARIVGVRGATLEVEPVDGRAEPLSDECRVGHQGCH